MGILLALGPDKQQAAYAMDGWSVGGLILAGLILVGLVALFRERGKASHRAAPLLIVGLLIVVGTVVAHLHK